MTNGRQGKKILYHEGGSHPVFARGQLDNSVTFGQPQVLKQWTQ